MNDEVKGGRQEGGAYPTLKAPGFGRVQVGQVLWERDLYVRADGIVESTGNIIRSVERLTTVIEKTVSSPLVKLVAFSAGATKAAKKFVGNRD